MKALIVLVCIFGFGAVIGAVLVGGAVFDGTVVENPYEEGLKWDAARKARDASSISVSPVGGPYVVGINNVRLVVMDPMGVMRGNVYVKLTRPETNQFDQRAEALSQGDGTYAISLEFPVAGEWVLHCTVMEGETPVTTSHKLHAR